MHSVSNVRVALGVLLIVAATLVVARAQAPARPAAPAHPQLMGAWAPVTGGRGLDPKLVPPPQSPLVLKPAFAANYEAQRKAEAESAAKGEPIASAAVSCLPYGMPRM